MTVPGIDMVVALALVAANAPFKVTLGEGALRVKRCSGRKYTDVCYQLTDCLLWNDHRSQKGTSG